jgi:hypothetical protein
MNKFKKQFYTFVSSALMLKLWAMLWLFEEACDLKRYHTNTTEPR